MVRMSAPSIPTAKPKAPPPAPPRRSLPLLLPDPKPGLRVALPNAAATRRLGALLAAGAQPGDIWSLAGPLGAGKTCLVAGLAAALGIRGPVTSPSFALVHQHVGRLPGRRKRPSRSPGAPAAITLFHVDLYRMHSAAELTELGLWEAAEGGGLLAIEWLERFPDAVPSDRLQVQLSHATESPGSRRPPGRIAQITAHGPQSRDRLARLRAALQTPPAAPPPASEHP